MSRYMYQLFDYVYSVIDEWSVFRVKFLDIKAKKPVKADVGCAGYDVFSIESVTIEPGARALVNTGLAIQVSRHFYARVAPRSGMSLKGIDIGAGVIDSSYRGPVKVLVINNGTEDFVIDEGAKIAQLILERCSNARVRLYEDLSETERGFGGFGSTGAR